MKTSHFIGLAFCVATAGMSLPARADQAVVNDSVQTVVITGSGNSVNQNNNTSIRNNNRRGTSSGTAVRNNQAVDVLGDNNTVRQNNQTDVNNRNQPRR
jgi:hypothetical protein